MLRSKRPSNFSQAIACRLRAGSIARLSIAGLMISLAGCSADIGRFGGSGLGLNGDQGASGTLPPPSQAMQQPSYAPPRDAGLPPPPRGEPPVRMSGLPDPAPRPEAAPLLPATKARPAPVAPPRASAPAAIPATPGESIEVQQGDTLYGISKRHRVAISELMTLNNLQNPNLRPGQKLVLPAGKRAVAARPASPATPVAAAPVAAPARVAAPATPVAPAAPSSDWTGSYTFVSGDTLSSVARRHNVKSAELQTANGITDPTKMRPGTVLKVPAGAGSPALEQAAAPVAPAAPSTGGPRIINAQTQPAEPAKRIAAVTPPGVKSDAGPVASVTPVVASPPDAPKGSGAARFRWPVKGKVISSFGPRGDNTHNDGVNISVPAGTDVLAAENGVVAYAGSELKGYGNLVLIRHENNWVSAYAHNDQLLVKRGDKIKRGQAIAKSGNTGAVDQPQVHFELRQGSKPVDPLPHMEAN